MRFRFLFIALALAACAPQYPSPAETVRTVYGVTQAHIGTALTPTTDIPMTDQLRADLARASLTADQRNEPFIEGDLVSGCQDCTSLTDLVLNETRGPQAGRATVEARFKIDGATERVIIWDMVETPTGWRVDNLRSPDGYDLRGAIQQQLAQDRGCARPDAERLVARCIEVSPATHPPCNAANSCEMIEAEIQRGCDLLNTAQRPAFCATGAAK